MYYCANPSLLQIITHLKLSRITHVLADAVASEQAHRHSDRTIDVTTSDSTTVTGSYVKFPYTDISGTWCISPFGLSNNSVGWRQSDGNFFSLDVMMTICEGLSGCNGFNPGGWTRSFLPNRTVDSYISNVTCGKGLVASLSPGTALSPQGTQYLVCTAEPGYAIDVWFEIYSMHYYPRLLIEDACTKDPACAAYMVAVDGSKGWLIRYSHGGTTYPAIYILLSSVGHSCPADEGVALGSLLLACYLEICCAVLLRVPSQEE